MGWRGALRSLAAEQRRIEREALRRQRELERQRKQYEKMQELEQAAYKVEVFENYIDVLMSIHKDCGKTWHWDIIVNRKPPEKPIEKTIHENVAKSKLSSFVPSFTDKLLKRIETKHNELIKALDDAKLQDKREFLQSLNEYNQQYAEWQVTQELAKRILSGEIEAFTEAIEQVDPFSEISEIGSSIEFHIEDNRLIEATIFVNSDEIIPKETKSLLKSGKLSVKKMTKTRYYELYQDYICGCAIRVARELLALLPIEMTIITTVGELLNTKTGHLEKCPILSVAIPRETLNRLNISAIDQSDAMENFVHNMKFIKTKGFRPVKRIEATEIQFGEI